MMMYFKFIDIQINWLGTQVTLWGNSTVVLLIKKFLK